MYIVMVISKNNDFSLAMYSMCLLALYCRAMKYCMEITVTIIKLQVFTAGMYHTAGYFEGYRLPPTKIYRGDFDFFSNFNVYNAMLKYCHFD